MKTMLTPHRRPHTLAWLPLAVWLLVPRAAFGELQVVATTPDLGSIAQAVGGKLINLTVLAKPTEDPHFVTPRPSYISKLNRADALIEGGAELESGWLRPLLEGARNPRLVPGAPGRILGNAQVEMLEVPGALDRARGDIHASGNPHYLTDPLNGQAVAGNLAQAFARLDPKHAGDYEAGARQFTAELKRRLLEWEARLAPFKGQRIVAYHNSWPYFARRFGLRVDLFLEPKPGIPPSPAHLSSVIATIKAEKIRVLFAEPYVSRRTAEMVARNTGARIVDVSYFPGGIKGTEGDYIRLMDTLVNQLAQALAQP